MKKAIAIAALVLALAGAGAGWYYWGPAPVPAGQPPLMEITAETIKQLRKEFNAAADRPRIIALLSPT